MIGKIIRAGPQPALKSVYGMENPLLTESACRWGAPRFDLIKAEHYLPAFEAGIAEARAEIDAIVSDPDVPDFENTIEALEYSGRTLDRVSSVFFNLLEAESDEEMQSIAEKVSPMLTEYSMYVSLNGDLFKRVRSVYERKDGLVLDKDREKLLENTYRSFVRNGAALSDEDKKIYSKYAEELSLLSLSFGNNVLRSSNAYSLHITDSGDMDGLPDYVARMGEAAAKEKGLDGWVFTLDYPSYAPFMKYSRKRELRRQMYMAYNTKGTAGETDNTGIVMRMADLRLRMSAMLGYRNYADYALEENMAKTPRTVRISWGRLCPARCRLQKTKSPGFSPMLQPTDSKTADSCHGICLFGRKGTRRLSSLLMKNSSSRTSDWRIVLLPYSILHGAFMESGLPKRMIFRSIIKT